MAALSPLGRVPTRRPPRPRYRVRFRRAIPAVLMILGLSALAGTVWLRVLDRVDAGAAGAAPCAPATAEQQDPRTVKVRVYNATTRDGLARAVSAQLRERGFAVVTTTNDPLADRRRVTGTAEIRYGSRGTTQAKLLRSHVPGVKVYKDARKDAVVDVALGPGYRRLATAAELARGRQAIAAGSAGAPSAATC